MGWLFDDAFHDRIDLQRKQVYHQQLLDAQSVGGGYSGHRDVPIGAMAGAAGASSDARAFTYLALLFAVLLITVAHGLTGPLVIAGAAAPAAVLFMLLTRALSGGWYLGFWRAYTTAFLGIFLYAALTIVIGFCVSLFHDPVSQPGFFNRLAASMLELRRMTAELSMASSRSIPMLVAAFVALHGPGWFACAMVLKTREEPYQRASGGLLIVWIVSAVVNPVALIVVIGAASLAPWEKTLP